MLTQTNILEVNTTCLLKWVILNKLKQNVIQLYVPFSTKEFWKQHLKFTIIQIIILKVKLWCITQQQFVLV